MTHYFSDNKDLPHNYRTINFDFNGINFKFNTDSGCLVILKLILGLMYYWILLKIKI